MDKYKEDFIEFMVLSGVLTFGDFTTKSGRKTPFFINTGKFKSGAQSVKLGEFYARAIMANFPQPRFNVLFGPAYKGIPLVVAASMMLSEIWKLDFDWCFNRKEVKDHGEGGRFIGHKIVGGDRVLLIDDVMTAGIATRESISLLSSAGVVLIEGGIISVDRMERGQGEKSAVQEIGEEFGIEFFSIVTLDEIVAHLHNKEIGGKVILDDEMHEKISAYRQIYGAKY